MLKAVSGIVGAMWLGLALAPTGWRDVVGLAGVMALLIVLVADRVKQWRMRTVHDGQMKK